MAWLLLYLTPGALLVAHGIYKGVYRNLPLLDTIALVSMDLIAWPWPVAYQIYHRVGNYIIKRRTNA